MSCRSRKYAKRGFNMAVGPPTLFTLALTVARWTELWPADMTIYMVARERFDACAARTQRRAARPANATIVPEVQTRLDAYCHVALGMGAKPAHVHAPVVHARGTAAAQVVDASVHVGASVA